MNKNQPITLSIKHLTVSCLSSVSAIIKSNFNVFSSIKLVFNITSQ
jgi:hypothetical protein